MWKMCAAHKSEHSRLALNVIHPNPPAHNTGGGGGGGGHRMWEHRGEQMWVAGLLG